MPVFFRDSIAAYATDVEQKVGGVAVKRPTTTPDMIRSFLFSKPGFTLEPFEPWGSCEEASKRRLSRQARETAAVGMDAATSCSWHDAGSVRPVFLRNHSADTSHIGSRREVLSGDTDEALYESVVRDRQLRAVVWKRRSFVDRLAEVPEVYQHRSVVPTAGVGSPRNRPTATLRSSSASPRGESEPCSHSAGLGCGQIAATGGVLPVVSRNTVGRRRVTGPPVGTSQGVLSDAFVDHAAVQRQRRLFLASRVAHVVDSGIPPRLAHPSRRHSATASPTT